MRCPVTDDSSSQPQLPQRTSSAHDVFELVVYRATSGPEPPDGGSWTLALAVAKADLAKTSRSRCGSGTLARGTGGHRRAAAGSTARRCPPRRVTPCPSVPLAMILSKPARRETAANEPLQPRFRTLANRLAARRTRRSCGQRPRRRERSRRRRCSVRIGSPPAGAAVSPGRWGRRRLRHQITTLHDGRFADVIAGPRGVFLGIARPDCVPIVWRGVVDASTVLAYFGDRREQEVVLPNGAVRDVRPRSF